MFDPPGRGRGRGKRVYTISMSEGKRRGGKRGGSGAPSSAGSGSAPAPDSAPPAALRKQNYSLFLKQRAVLFSAKKWK